MTKTTRLSHWASLATMGVASMIMFCCPAIAGELEGWVKDAQSGAPVVGASVTLQNATGPRTTATNSKGFYSFIGLEPGKYSVGASLGDRSDDVWGVFVCPDSVTQIDLLLHGPCICDQFLPAWSWWTARPRSTSDIYSITLGSDGSFRGLDPCL